MSSETLSIGVIRAQIRAIRDKAPRAKVFGIFSPGRWTGPSIYGTGGEEIAIYQCDSPLQMRLALQSAPETASATVIMTPLDESKISDDILVRFVGQRLHSIKNWEIVRSLFKARQLDPRITRYPFLADLLLEHADTRDFPPVAGGLVDAETVWGILLVERLGLPVAHPDMVDLLKYAAESNLASRWKGCSAEFRAAATSWISETAGETARVILNCLEGEHGEKAMAIGLVMGVVYHKGVGHDLDKAAGRLEGYVGTTDLSIDAASRWRDAASVAVGQVSNEARRRCLDQAETILENIGAQDHAWRSDELESGFEQRLSQYGQALVHHITSRATSIPAEIQNLYDSIQQHRLGRNDGRRRERVEMSLRLARWLTDQNSARDPKPSSLTAISQGYAADSGYADWARQVLRGGEPNKDLATAFARLVDRVTELREEENRRFGMALAEQRAMGDARSGLIPVELIAEQVVARVANQVPVLLLLVDGMSWAVFRELTSDIKSRDWIELSFGATATRLMGLAALPSVTEVCRTSLLCGELRRGQASDELQGFTANPKLLAASQPGFPPKLYHKAALEGDDDPSLSGDVRQALSNKKQRVVGIVINAVDDHLDKGDQIDAIWTTQQIRVLEPILAEAGAAGRAVILLSDHGHILDRKSEYREAGDGLRWRRPGEATKDEVEVSTSRVVMPDGRRIVVPWSERLRYGPKKNGYHGGVTPQEMLIPIGILWPKLQVPEGFVEFPPDRPSWWTEPTVKRPAPMEVAEEPKPRKKKPALPLFDKLPERASAPKEAEEPWIKGLLGSEIFALQKKRAGRVVIPDEKMQRLLAALVSRGGSMTVAALAGAMEEPEHRLPGLLAVMQRLLNVEGYAILDRQDAANTVTLNVPLLKKQFELE